MRAARLRGAAAGPAGRAGGRPRRPRARTHSPAPLAAAAPVAASGALRPPPHLLRSRSSAAPSPRPGSAPLPLPGAGAPGPPGGRAPARAVRQSAAAVAVSASLGAAAMGAPEGRKSRNRAAGGKRSSRRQAESATCVSSGSPPPEHSYLTQSAPRPAPRPPSQLCPGRPAVCPTPTPSTSVGESLRIAVILLPSATGYPQSGCPTVPCLKGRSAAPASSGNVRNAQSQAC